MHNCSISHHCVTYWKPHLKVDKNSGDNYYYCLNFQEFHSNLTQQWFNSLIKHTINFGRFWIKPLDFSFWKSRFHLKTYLSYRIIIHIKTMNGNKRKERLTGNLKIKILFSHRWTVQMQSSRFYLIFQCSHSAEQSTIHSTPLINYSIRI